MYSVAVCGASGKMGSLLVDGIVKHPDLKVHSAIVDKAEGLDGKDIGISVGKSAIGIAYSSQFDLTGCDLVIDFSRPIATQSCLNACNREGVPLVIGTTGHSAQQQQAIIDAAKQIPILQAANMSLGINLCLALVRQAVGALNEDYDIEIQEAHHRHKVDAPSGTALALARAAAEARGKELEDIAVYDRTGQQDPRAPGTIGFQVIRGGDIIGEHAVRLIAEGESIEIHHKARSRNIFVIGALAAGLRLLKQPKAGLYSMADVLNL